MSRKLYVSTVRLAFENPELRPLLLPLVKKAGPIKPSDAVMDQLNKFPVGHVITHPKGKAKKVKQYPKDGGVWDVIMSRTTAFKDGETIPGYIIGRELMEKKAGQMTIRPGMFIQNIDNPKWGDWKVDNAAPGVPGMWEIHNVDRGRSHAKVVDESELNRFWKEVKPSRRAHKAAASKKVKTVSMGHTKWDVYDDGSGNLVYITKPTQVTITNPYTGEIDSRQSRKYVFRIAPDHWSDGAWRLDYYDLAIWVSLTRTKYKTPEEAARDFAALDFNKVLKSGSPKEASPLSLASEILKSQVDVRGLAKVKSALHKAGDQQSTDLLREIQKHFLARFTMSTNEEDALNRLAGLAMRGEGWDPAMIRNNVFKIANSLGMRLPSGMFASDHSKAEE